MVRLLKNEIFARKSETRREPDLDQLQLFVKSDAPPAPEPVEELVIETHTRKKRGRKALPKDLPRVEVIHGVPEDKNHRRRLTVVVY